MVDSSLSAARATVGAQALPSSIRTWSVIGLLTFAYMFSVLDRQILNLLAPAIQQDLGITDFQLSYLQGFFFVALYVAMGPMFGWMADHMPRKQVAALGIGIWSAATALSSQAQNYSGLAMGRLGVGAGESALGPAATSMISDMLPPERRAKALALFGLGPQFGNVLALLAAPFLIPATTINLGLIGALKPWQAAFLFAGLPGLLITIALLMIREPVRHGVRASADRPMSFAALRFVASRKRAFVGAILGSILMVCVAYTNSFNIPLFYHRTFGWNQNRIGVSIGLLNLFTLVPAGLAGGFLASRLRQKGRPEGTYLVMMIGSLGFSIPAMLTWLMPTAELALVTLGLANIGLGLVTPLISAVIPDLAPNEFRGQIVSWYLSGAQIFGAAIAPLGVAALTKYAYSPSHLGYSLATFNILLTPVALGTLAFGFPAVRLLAKERSLQD